MNEEEETASRLANFTSLLPEIQLASEHLEMSQDSIQDDEDQLLALKNDHTALLERYAHAYCYVSQHLASTAGSEPLP